MTLKTWTSASFTTKFSPILIGHVITWRDSRALKKQWKDSSSACISQLSPSPKRFRSCLKLDRYMDVLVKRWSKHLVLIKINAFCFFTRDVRTVISALWMFVPENMRFVPSSACKTNCIFTESYLFGTLQSHQAGYTSAMVRILARRSRAQNTHSETKRAWYAAETYQKGTSRYLPYQNSAKWPWYFSHNLVSDLIS